MLKWMCSPKYGGASCDNDGQTVYTLLFEAGVNIADAYRLAFFESKEELYFYLKEHPDIVISEWLVNYVKPTLTWANKVGMFFSQGTECTCCLGWRVFAAISIYPFIFYIGSLYGKS